jgi:hypothetical protein
MSQDFNSNFIIIGSPDVSLKTSDVVERIISGIMQAGEVDIVGINDGIYLVCSALNMATEIAKVYLDDACLANLQAPALGRASALLAHLTQKQSLDNYNKMAELEEKTLEDAVEQTVSVSRTAPMERLLTISLLRLAKYDKIKIAAAGGSINDAVALALKLTTGQISKEIVGIKLLHLYSIVMRNDPTKSIAAASIYLQKKVPTEYSKRQNLLLQKIESGK